MSGVPSAFLFRTIASLVALSRRLGLVIYDDDDHDDDIDDNDDDEETTWLCYDISRNRGSQGHTILVLVTGL